MSNPDQLVERFLGGDPIAGTQALRDLLVLGNSGEDALFSRRIEDPKTMQVRRRWLQYVASRPNVGTVRLIDRMENQDRFKDAHVAAYLFAGISENPGVMRALYAQLSNDFKDSQPTRATLLDYDPAWNRLLAWGYAGGGAAMLWDNVSGSRFAWEKLRTSAFRGACAAFARTGEDHHRWAIEQLITHEWPGYKLTEISDQPDTRLSNEALHGAELAGEAHNVFLTWRHGKVADHILARWSKHAHWRVRDFGAQILASLGFQRTVRPVTEWLQREPVQSVRISLLHTLERSETVSGTDALIDHFTSSRQEGQPHIAKAAWRASDKNRALAVLNAVVKGDDPTSAEAVVSLARLGQRHPQLPRLLDSHDDYCRLNAALAVAYIGDRALLESVLTMQREAATPLERIGLAAAAAILGRPNGAIRLNSELVAAANSEDYFKRVDLFFVHRFLQLAVLDGLATGGEQSKNHLTAWRAEMEPLDPVLRPVELAMPGSAPPSTRPVPVAKNVPSEGHGGPAQVGRGPLKLFISYSHRDEKMRAKLGEHLAPLVDEGLIRIWHDREIEAGANWEGEINKEIGEADLILLLVSASFLQSRYCREELLRAIGQRTVGKSVPIPIILRPCDWVSVFNQGDYKTQALPRDNRPVASGRWPNHDAAFEAIVRELRVKIERMRSK